MDIILIIIGIILILIGIVGCIVPALPGPAIAYFGLIALQFTEKAPFSVFFLVVMALATILITVLDYLVPAMGTKKWGGTKSGVRGCMIGTIVGLFVIPPFGIFIMPFVGAFIGEIIHDNNIRKALKAATGSFLGFLGGIFLKTFFCLLIAIIFVWKLLF